MTGHFLPQYFTVLPFYNDLTETLNDLHAPLISHFLYADDIVIFVRTNLFEATKLKQILNAYCLWCPLIFKNQLSFFLKRPLFL